MKPGTPLGATGESKQRGWFHTDGLLSSISTFPSWKEGENAMKKGSWVKDRKFSYSLTTFCLSHKMDPKGGNSLVSMYNAPAATPDLNAIVLQASSGKRVSGACSISETHVWLILSQSWGRQRSANCLHRKRAWVSLPKWVPFVCTS